MAVNWDKFPERRWDNATVPYVISKLYGEAQSEEGHYYTEERPFTLND